MTANRPASARRLAVATAGRLAATYTTSGDTTILSDSEAPGSSVELAFRAHGVSSGQFYTWRKQFRSGELTGFVPISVAPEPPSVLAAASMREETPAPTVPAPGLVEVELPSGIRLRISGEVEVVTLRRILSALR